MHIIGHYNSTPERDSHSETDTLFNITSKEYEIENMTLNNNLNCNFNTHHFI